MTLPEPKPLRRGLRIAAVTATTVMLMATTAFGVTVVQQLTTAGAPVVASAEAAPAPARVVKAPVTLPDRSNRPALPNLKPLLDAAVPVPAQAAPQAAAPQTATRPTTRPAAKPAARPATRPAAKPAEREADHEAEHESEHEED